MIKTGLEILLWLAAVPFLQGVLLLRLIGKKPGGIPDCLIAGWLGMFAVCELTAVPMILWKAAFHLFVRVLGAAFLAEALVGAFLCRREIVRLLRRWLRGCFRLPWTLYISAAAVVLQGFFYVNYMVLNEDDAYYIGVAATALETDTMYLYSPYTGHAVEHFNLRYILSPLSMLQAFWSDRMAIPAATLAHTVLPPFLVALAYLVYYQLGKLLFSNDRKQAGLFVIMMSLVNITSYYCVRTQGAVLLLRIWQGKAILASVLLPFLFCHCYRMAKCPEERGNFPLLLTAMTACCLVSSMGIALPPVMLGIFGIVFGLLKKNCRYVLQMAAGCLPSVCFGVLYLILKALR